MTNKPSSDDSGPINGFFSEGGGHRGAHIRTPTSRAANLVAAVPAMRRTPEPKTARARISAQPRQNQKPMGPTPERMAKGDLPPARTAGGFHRAIPPVETLFKAKKLGWSNDCVTENLALFQAAEKLKLHYDQKNAMGIKAQDINKVGGRGASDNLTEEEIWVEHNKTFEIAKRLMGWTSAHPARGSARIVIAIVCEEMSVTEAAEMHLVAARKEVMISTAMEKLREGLFSLAIHWRFIRG